MYLHLEIRNEMHYLVVKNQTCPQHCLKLSTWLAFDANGK